MNEERHPSQPDEQVEDLDVTSDEADAVKGGDAAAKKPAGSAKLNDFHFTHTIDKASTNL
jgi:type VI protein secretion system component Hcp